jgi:hypothetical protein
MKRIPITQDQALNLITAGGCVLMLELQHDTGCPTLTTGNGADCACEPDQQFFEYVDAEDAALGAGGIY